VQAPTANFSVDNELVRYRESSRSVEAEMPQRHEQRVTLLIISLSRLCSSSKLLASTEPEINHPLTAVVINAQACLRWLFADPPDLRQVRATMERMVGNVNAMTGLVNRNYVPAEQTARVLADLNEVIYEVTDLVLNEAA
jgi:hypothetical protein